MSLQPAERRDFIRDMISDDLASGKHQAPVTRFPPEPNGYLHIGHAKSICLNFGIAQEFPGARCHLRFDDTNPSKEDQEYVDSIQEDIRWLGFDWGDNLFFASNMFGFFYECAVSLIRKGLAYVDEQTVEEIRAQRGNVNVPGQESPYRNRSVEENLARFQAMKNGEIPEGRAILRARIDMASSNMNMRDPVLYRIMFAEHHNTGSSWCIYPMYDFAHPLEDAYEHITHSLCTLEFENHRPLYDWVIENCPVPARPRQTEFARLNLTYTVMSKRKLLQLVQEGHVSGWDDPRMPTVSGMRRRGGYCITCTDYRQDADGNITEIFCEHIPGTIGSNPPEGIQCRAAIHWVSTRDAVDGEIRIYDRLFTEENPDAAEEGFLSVMNPGSLTVITNAKLEPSLAEAEPEFRCQFERLGYFVADRRDHVPGKRAVFNRTVALKDSWAKKQK